MKKRYETYGMGDFVSKLWYVYDLKYGNLVSGLRFNTKKQARMMADEMNMKKEA